MNPALAATLQVALLLVVLGLAYVPLGDYMASVYRSERDLGASECCIASPGSIRSANRPGSAMRLRCSPSRSSVFCSSICCSDFRVYCPGPTANPDQPATAFNTAVSFVSNTNWQSYSPEQVMSNLTQMIGLAVQNFASAAVGLAVAVALIRGLVNRRGDGQLGNFWVDLVRGVIRILLPLSIIMPSS